MYRRKSNLLKAVFAITRDTLRCDRRKRQFAKLRFQFADLSQRGLIRPNAACLSPVTKYWRAVNMLTCEVAQIAKPHLRTFNDPAACLAYCGRVRVAPVAGF